MNSISLESGLKQLGALLATRSQHFELVAIGGGALLVLGFIQRPTKDLDIVALMEGGELVSAKILPIALSEAIKEVGSAYGLGSDWVNQGPADLLVMGLPDGFQSRLHCTRYGGLAVYYADRLDQICFKLYAAVDQGPKSQHFADLLKLNPTEDEVKWAADWCRTHDVSEEFSGMLEEVVLKLKERNA